MRQNPRNESDINRKEERNFQRRMGNGRAGTWLISAVLLFGILGFFNVAESQAASKDIELVIHGVSKHFAPRQKNGQPWNERNPGIGLRLSLNKTGTLAFQGGAYENSYFLRSFYAGVDWLPIRWGSLSLGAGVGAATGYRILGAAPAPVAEMTMQWKVSQRMTIRMRMLPPVHPKMTGAAALEIGLRLPKIGTVER